MADQRINCDLVSRDGLEEAYLTEASSPPLSSEDRYLVRNNGRMMLRIATGEEGTTVTMEIRATVDGQVVNPRVVSIPANSHRVWGDWPPQHYNDALADVALAFSSVEGVKVAAFCLP